MFGEAMLIFFDTGENGSDELIKEGIKECARIYDIKIPQRYDIVRKEGHKPRLQPQFLHFNISHSGNMTALALSEKEVGIDIQYHTPCDYKAIAQRFFDKREMAEIGENKKVFFDLWAAKEAYAKKNGVMLTDGLKEYIKDKDVVILNLFENYSLALACEEKDYIFMFLYKNNIEEG